MLYSPAGGVKYRMKQHSRFEQHLAYVDEHGLGAVVALARESGATFTSVSPANHEGVAPTGRIDYAVAGRVVASRNLTSSQLDIELALPNDLPTGTHDLVVTY